MNVSDAIAQRRSIKKFQDRPLTREELEPLLEAAVLAGEHAAVAERGAEEKAVDVDRNALRHLGRAPSLPRAPRAPKAVSPRHRTP